MPKLCIELDNGQIIPLGFFPSGGLSSVSPMSQVGQFSNAASPMAEICIRLGNGQLISLVPAGGAGAIAAQSAQGLGASPMVGICIKLSNGQIVPLVAAHGAAGSFSAQGSVFSPLGGACSQSINVGGQVLPLCI